MAIRACGIEPAQRKIIVVKSTVHFRNLFEPEVKGIFDVLLPGMAEQDPTALVYARCRRPIFPLEEI